MPQTVTTYSDQQAVVSSDSVHFQSIQTALDATPSRMPVHIHWSYDTAHDDAVTIPVRRQFTVDYGTRLPPVTIETQHKRPFGAYAFGFETPTLTLRGAKFATVSHVHTTGQGFLCESTEENSCNSVVFNRCTADRPAGNGFTLDPKSHAATLRDCIVIGAQGYGVFSNGPASVALARPQLEDCKEAGLKVRRCEMFVQRDGYIEGNATNPEDADADVTLADVKSFEIAGTYFNGRDRATHALSFYGATNGTLRRAHYTGYGGRQPVLNQSTGRIVRE